MRKYPVHLGEPPKARGMREVDSQVSVQFLLSLVRDPSFVSAYSWVKGKVSMKEPTPKGNVQLAFLKKLRYHTHQNKKQTKTTQYFKGII